VLGAAAVALRDIRTGHEARADRGHVSSGPVFGIDSSAEARMRHDAQEVRMSTQPGMTRRSPAHALTIATTIVHAALLAPACSKPTAPGSGETAVPTETAPTPEAPAAAPAAAPIQGDRYTLDQDGTQVTLGVTGTKGEIAFELVTQPADPKCRLRLSGTAKEKGGDLETREDEQGEMIAVSEYLHESKDCWVSISLEMDKRSMAWVSTADCPSVPESCWLDTFGPLRKQ
jgi:hypothetical protein